MQLRIFVCFFVCVFYFECDGVAFVKAGLVKFITGYNYALNKFSVL